MQVCIEDTEELCEATQAAALVSHLAHQTNDDYVQGTTRWSQVRERLDGKFDTVVCISHDYTGKTVQEFSLEDYEIIV